MGFDDLSNTLCPALASTAIPTWQLLYTTHDWLWSNVVWMWANVSDVGPSLKQHWVNVTCLLRSTPGINSRPNTATLTKCWARKDVESMFVQHLSTIYDVGPTLLKSTLIQRLVSAGLPIHMYRAYIIYLGQKKIYVCFRFVVILTSG